MHKAVQVVLIIFSLLLGSLNSRVCIASSSNPKTIPQQQIIEIINGLPDYAHFSIAGMRFFNNKLYVATNIGLLELETESSIKLYRWLENDAVVEGPWLDSANKLLWFWLPATNNLIHFNGTEWIAGKLPQNGYTRGDILKGFRGSGNKEYFWLEGAHRTWRWDNKNDAWIEETRLPSDGSLVRILPMQKRLLFVQRHEILDFLVKSSTFKSDNIHYFTDKWLEVPNSTGKNFFTEQAISLNDTAYIRTRNGEILCVTESGVSALNTPGFCEAITFTSAGSLLASIRNFGIYEYTGKWHRRFEYPLQENDEHWAYLAEANGQVAFATSSMPKLTKDYKPSYTGTTGFWFSSDNKLNRIKI
jgi:hypothetical protein